MENFWKDVRFGLRTLLRSPATTAVALLTLALGIGANSAIFSVVNGVLLAPLSYPEPDELVFVWESSPGKGLPRFSVAPPNFDDWRRQSRSFEALAAISQGSFNLTGGGRPEAILGASVTFDFFRVTGVEPMLGRGFQPDEDKPGGVPVVVLSQALWQRRFGSDPKIVGRPVQIDGESRVVVGVMPQGFDFPFKSALWFPLGIDFAAEHRGAHWLVTVARLKKEVSLERAESEMKAIAARLEKQYPDSNTGWTVELIRVSDMLVENIRPALLMLLLAVAFVLLIACANVANLLLARVATREREIAVRTALGAGRLRLIRQMLTESLVLFVLGGTLGLLLASWSTKALLALHTQGIPRAERIGLDGRVVVFTFAIALLTGLVFGLVPALSATGGKLHETLKEGGRAMAGGARGRLVRNLLVLGEVAVALVLLVGAGLLLQSFARLRSVEPGLRPAGVLTAEVTLPEARYKEPQRQVAFFQEVLQRTAALPGVESAASIFPLPLEGKNFVLSFVADGRPIPAPSEAPSANIRVISPDYFRTLRIPVLDGRPFDARDDEDALPVIVVNRSMAREVWPGESPLGKRITFDDPAQPDAKWRMVVGVVGDVRSGLGKEAGWEVYWPQLQDPIGEATLVVRVAGRPESLAPPLRGTVTAVDRDLPLGEVRTMEDVVRDSLSQSRFQTVLLGIFAGLALLLASIGVYGVVSYSVAQRTHEIGIRMALGARRPEVLRMVVRQGMLLVLVGVGVGIALALFLVSYLSERVSTYIYGIRATDPLTFLLVPLVLLAAALVANWLPARRATQVDPLVALRYE